MGVLYVEHANVLELCYIELLSGDGSPYSILSGPLLKWISISKQWGIIARYSGGSKISPREGRQPII